MALAPCCFVVAMRAMPHLPRTAALSHASPLARRSGVVLRSGLLGLSTCGVAFALQDIDPCAQAIGHRRDRDRAGGFDAAPTDFGAEQFPGNRTARLPQSRRCLPASSLMWTAPEVASRIWSARARPLAPPMSAISPVRSLLAPGRPEDLQHDRAAPARRQALPLSGCFQAGGQVAPPLLKLTQHVRQRLHRVSPPFWSTAAATPAERSAAYRRGGRFDRQADDSRTTTGFVGADRRGGAARSPRGRGPGIRA